MLVSLGLERLCLRSLAVCQAVAPSSLGGILYRQRIRWASALQRGGLRTGWAGACRATASRSSVSRTVALLGL